MNSHVEYPHRSQQLYSKCVKLTIHLGNCRVTAYVEHSLARTLVPSLSLCGTEVFPVSLFSKTVKNEHILILFKSSIKHVLNQTSEITHQRLTNYKTALEIKCCASTWNTTPAADETLLHVLQDYFRVCCFVNQV